MPRKLWKTAFTYDELKDGNGNGAMVEEKEGGGTLLDMDSEDARKVKDGQKDEEEGDTTAGRSGGMEEQDGGMQAEEHETPHRDVDEDRDQGIIHTLSHTHPCPVHTKLHTHTLTLPSKRDKTSRMKITLFPSVGRRMFKKSERVTMETGGQAVAMAQVNIPQTLFYKQNANLVLQSEGKRYTDDVCTCDDICISKATKHDASHELSINTTENDFSLSDVETDIQSGVDVSQSDHGVNIRASASTDHRIRINEKDSTQSDPGNADSTRATTDYTVSISGMGLDSEIAQVKQSVCTDVSHMISNSIVDHVTDIESIPHSASQSINTTTTASMSQVISVNKISHRVSISSNNANQYASTKTSIRQAIRIRLPATVRNSVRAYFSPAHTLTHTRSHSATHPQSVTCIHVQTQPKSQNRPLFTSNLQ